MQMPFITKYLFATILISPMIILVGCHFKKKLLFISYAILNVLLASWLLVDEILSYGATEVTLEEKIHIFFINDVSMIFYFVFLPLVIIGSIFPATVFIIQNIKNKADIS